LKVLSKISEEDFSSEINLNSVVGNHPCIVPFLGASDLADHSRHFLVTQLMPCNSAEDFLMRAKEFPLDFRYKRDTDSRTIPDAGLLKNLQVVANMLVDASAGVLHCHKSGVLHCDIAARNVLVYRLGDAHRMSVCDFGLSVKLPAGQTKTKLSSNRPFPVSSTAPETWARLECSAKTDVYQFGMFLFEIVEREPPFESLSADQIRTGVSNPKVKLCPVRQSCMPVEWYQLMTDCWAHLPEDRPTMESVNERLSDFADRVGKALSLERVYKPFSPARVYVGRQSNYNYIESYVPM